MRRTNTPTARLVVRLHGITIRSQGDDESRRSEAVDKMVVFRVRTDPKPIEGAAIFVGQCAVV